MSVEPGSIATMFNEIAGRYDRINSAMTFGFDRRWRVIAAKALNASPGDRVIDVAAGTGSSTVEYSQGGAWCVAVDLSPVMLEAGCHRGLPMVAGDVSALPFADNSFDAATISWGIRNFSRIPEALREIARVVRPGGKLVICEASQPDNWLIRALYHRFILRAVTAIGRRLSSHPEAYTYLATSIRQWLSQRELAEVIADAGWTRVEWMNLAGGVTAIHRAIKPEDKPE